MSFLPAAPKAEPAEVPAPAPEPKPDLYASAVPASIEVSRPKPAAPVIVDTSAQQAEERFSLGKRYYQQGEMALARKEFDAALELMMTAVEKSTDRAKAERRFEDLVNLIYRYDIEGLGSGEVAQQRPYDKAPFEEILDLTFPVDPGIKTKVKEEVSATQSQLPLTVNDTVVGFINYFSSDRGKKTVIAGLRRSGRYRPMIQRILAEEGVPQELIYLAQAESGFLPRAVSRAAAVGMWQFIQYRGRQYGLNQTAHTDDRLDPEKATRAAARHLRDLYNEFGNWPLAIAAYNCGPGCVSRAVERTGYADYWELRARNAIPRETTNYVPIIMALTIIQKNAKDYGLEGIELDAPLEYDTLDVDAPTNISLLADLADRPVSELRDLNPALVGSVAPAGYQVHVPKGSTPTVLAGLALVPASKRLSWRMHRVASGETMASIARQFSLSPNALLSANNTTEAIEANQWLMIPAGSVREAKPVKASKLRVFSRRSSSTRVAATKAPAKSRPVTAHRSWRRRGHGTAVGASS